MLSPAGEANDNTQATFFCKFQYIDTPVLADQQKLKYITSVRTLDAV